MAHPKLSLAILTHQKNRFTSFSLPINAILKNTIMAGVAKWLRQWIVVPPFEGSIPFTRPGSRGWQNRLDNPLDKSKGKIA